MAALPLGAAAGSALSATVIPAIAAPVVLLGAMAVLHATGFFINTLTLFILVLAIGLLVDDAIIVVENFWRLMRDEGLSPKDAAFKPMRQITGARGRGLRLLQPRHDALALGRHWPWAGVKIL